MFKKIVLLFGLFALLASKAEASHLMGGEITWDCQGSGTYIFTLKLYRDCNGITSAPTLSLSVFNNPLFTGFNVNLVSQNDISPSCNPAGPAISCAAAEADPSWPLSSTPVAGAVQESVYQSAPISLPGVPPPGGWVFTFDECCRNTSITNLNVSSFDGLTLRAIMYPYSGMNENPCFDSSPKFQESPNSIICVGYPFTYNPNAYDPDLDSLNYSWAQPLDDISGASYNPGVDPAILGYNPGYSFSSPLPGTAQDPSNVPATVDPATGEISFTSYTQGNFLTIVKVQSWKCGQLVSEIFREMQVVLLPCASNNAPSVTFTSYNDTVAAGTLVNFAISGNDPGLLADGVTPQTVTITASGTQFGSGFTSTTTGCLNPPCATLTAPPPVSAITNVSTVFSWQTSCNHISTNTGCNTQSNTYTFVFSTRDDFCPAPAEKISTVSITVLATPIVSSPLPKCVSVLPSGDAVLTWATPSDPAGTFNSYHIYTSGSAGGPFSILDSIFVYGQTTYTHIGANANAAPVYYYIQTRSGCAGMVYAMPQDTVASMFLTVTNPGNGTAVLSWNPIAAPAVPTSTGIYSVYVEFPAGVWTLTGTTNLNTFLDSVFVCNANINFRVEIADSSGCISVSSIDGGVFQNLIVPDIPVFDTLSVDDFNNALMSWNTSASADVEAYVIYQFDGTSWVPVDTVFGINNTTFNYLLSDADISSEQYRLTAYDSCGNISSLGPVQSTMFLQSTPDICNRSVILNWSASPAIGTGLSGYRIWQSTVGIAGPFALIGTVPPATLTFTASSLAPSTTYYYKIEAFDGSGKTSSSNRISFYSATPIPPLFSYLRKVSVVDPDKVVVTCHVDVAASTLKYKIMRSNDNVSFSLVGSIPAGAVSPVVFNDVNVLTDEKSYYYKVINVDSCGFDGIETNIGRTMLLNAISDSENMINTLSWNDYETWSGSVMSYNIYRGIDGVMDLTPIANVPYTGSGNNFYTDDVTGLLQGQGIFNYYIEALEGFGNTYGFSENSLSNIAEAYQDPIVFVPNAFKPIGQNPIFIPVTTFVDFTEYEFSVFNRWGLQVFTTNMVDQGWDGMHKSSKCEMGVYVYLVRFKTSKGEYIEFKGSVTLLR
ncbi:MAG: gliding motility-associated C-terminal domain-containing protein [Bacteroidota bacterium]|nr:gliding motility-associated C-terminal domain-containing protein [Bacteroidota bacterium]